ncbi:hypothetical protein Tco_0585501 [Tanacetum coccineum]
MPGRPRKNRVKAPASREKESVPKPPIVKKVPGRRREPELQNASARGGGRGSRGGGRGAESGGRGVVGGGRGVESGGRATMGGGRGRRGGGRGKRGGGSTSGYYKDILCE